jgi:hypothetical protein
MPGPDDDLALTIRELSNVYEELSLLYRISEVFSFLSVDEICARIAAEAVNTLGVRTAAVLFLDEKAGTLSAKAALGDWNPERVIRRDAGPVWKAIESKKPPLFASLPRRHTGTISRNCRLLWSVPLSGRSR